MAVVRYVAMGKAQRIINVDYSMNQGRSWQHKDLLPGQTFPIPPNCTNLLMDNVPYNPGSDYEVRDGKVVGK